MRLLYIKRKGRKWQQVPISYEGFKPLHEYITRHRSYLASRGVGTGSRKDDPVFLTRRGEPVKISSIDALFERLRKRTGIADKPLYSHQGRRFMATTQLNAGRNPLDVQRQMGHTTLAMTNKYFSQTTGGLKKSHEQYSPLRKKSENERSSGLGSGYYEE
jgi:integrase/recombinase XerD